MNYLAENFKKMDPLDFEDCILQIEKTFAVKFDDNDINKINSFNDLTNLTTSYLNISQVDSCTSQQAFYKFKRAYLFTQNINQKIKPSSLLEELFPKSNRREQIKSIEQELGFNLNMLEPPAWITYSLLGIFVLSCILLFDNTFYGVSGLLISIFGFYFAFKFGNTLTYHHVSDLIRSILQTNYHLCRSSESYNPKEIEKIIIEIFTDNLYLERDKFDSNTSFS
ncbi:hypothetical protein [Sphingobacterium bovistauri]|uniref:Acyl carrier protein n=1 Tax=Sphingobacterium bovistauri TaxID=2781959 RepID=A0ABS7Z5L0_9SPHI|nr:hypothetical protein [Sphingobacterium bovistauri]MCA5005483.1 hypothetical protein [Sphingobacterium bovistauri]